MFLSCPAENISTIMEKDILLTSRPALSTELRNSIIRWFTKLSGASKLVMNASTMLCFGPELLRKRRALMFGK